METAVLSTLITGMLLMSGCGTEGGSNSSASSSVSSAITSSASSSSEAAALSTLRVVSTPNPSLFPLLTAQYLHPDLPVQIVPVTGSKTIDSNLSVPLGDALASMTYVAAKKSQSGTIVPMRLKSAAYYHGFMLVTRQSDGVTAIDALKGKNLLVSGPIGSGKDGGPDIFLQAYLAQSGLTTADFSVYYMPLNDGVAAFSAQTPLDDGDGDPSNDTPADAYLLVEPAATGMVMMMASGATPVEKGVDLQEGFPAYGSWSFGELPLGGFSVVRSVDDNPDNAALIASVVTAYNEGAQALMQGSFAQRQAYAGYISAQIDALYGQYGISVPAEVIIASLLNGALVYHGDDDIGGIKSDLKVFLESVIGSSVDDAFFE